MWKFLIVFAVLSGLMTLAVAFFGVDLHGPSYWDRHGWLLLIFLAFFPRLTLLFSSIPFGGFFWWIGFIFAPHYLVAILATLNYWHSNPILVTLSWVIALGGESSEKYAIRRTVRIRRVKTWQDDVIDVEVKPK